MHWAELYWADFVYSLFSTLFFFFCNPIALQVMNDILQFHACIFRFFLISAKCSAYIFQFTMNRKREYTLNCQFLKRISIHLKWFRTMSKHFIFSPSHLHLVCNIKYMQALLIDGICRKTSMSWSSINSFDAKYLFIQITIQ